MNATEQKFAEVWDLDSLLPHPDSDAFRKHLESFEQDLASTAERSDSLPAVSGANAAEWRSFLESFADVTARLTDLHAFIGCHAAAEAENKLFQQLEAKLASQQPLHSRIVTNIEFAMKTAMDADFEALAGGDEWLAGIRFFLEDARKNAELRLPKDQELLAAELGVDGIHAWGRLYDRVSGALRIRVMERGEVVEKSVSQVQFDSPERSVRQNNFYASNVAWNGIADTCADALNHISGTRLTKYRRLGLEDHLVNPLRANRLKRETLEAMWSAIGDRKEMVVKYLDKKAELIGVDRLAWYDQQAPLTLGGGAKSAVLSWDGACDHVIGTFQRFSPEFGDFAKMALADRWIEAENRAGKRQGGFCTGFPTKKQSRIFMTFTHSADSMSTLAHELGHAYHSHVLRDQPLLLQDYPMNLAETASTFAEAVLGEERLSTSDCPQEQLTILDHMLGDAVAFLMNIHTRFIFEDNFHRERAGGELTADRFSELMVAAQREAYAGALADDGWNPSFWISKLHFYISGLAFYNFPYTFGYLLSLGVYALKDEVGDSFPERYRELLIATGCKETEDAVQSTFDYDLSGPDFWNKSLDIVERRVERYLELAAQV